jgi:hypothetical protein
MRLLLDAGALPSVPASEERVTPLHEAAGAGQLEEALLLVRFGADRGARDRQGRNPAQLAESWPEVAAALQEEPEVAPPPAPAPAARAPCVTLGPGGAERATGLGCTLAKELGEATTHWVGCEGGCCAAV